MFLEKIALLNFRNYKTLSLELDNQLNVLIGDNAQGKTNVLESIYYLGTVRSHRTNRDSDLIKWDENYMVIKAWGTNQLGKFQIEIAVNKEGKKKLKVNGVEKRKIGDILGTVKVVLFSPEDLSLVKGNPSVRRKFMDYEISQISPFYYNNLVNYNRIIGQRNTLLKDIRSKRAGQENLFVWNQQLAALGAKLISKRIEVLKKLIPLTRLMHRKITNGKEELEIKYISNVIDKEGLNNTEIEELFLEKLQLNQREEIERGMSVLGPHRDDLGFFINGKEMKNYGSQGQQRTSSLSLKLAELELVKGETGEYPVLLLDDVMSELDEDRRKYLLETVQSKIQTFITATDNSLISKQSTLLGNTFEVRGGQIIFKEV